MRTKQTDISSWVGMTGLVLSTAFILALVVT
jgi:hypothetical protein